MKCFFVGGSVAEKAVFGGDEPVITIQVFENIIDAIYGNAKSGKGQTWVALKISQPWIVYVLAISVRDPEETFRAFHNAGDEVVGDGGGIANVLSEDAEIVTIVAVESGHGAEPHESLTVFIDTVHLIGREALRDIKSGQLVLRLWCLRP